MLSRMYDLRLAGLLLTAPLSIFFGFFAVDSAAAIQIVKHGGYWLMLATVLLLLFNLWDRCREFLELQPFRWQGWVRPLGFIGAVSGLIVILQPNGYKITMDEPVLAATALQMHQEKQVMTASRAYEINGSFVLLGGYVDKRPYFYPFLVSVLHDLTGYRSLQGVGLNSILTPVFLVFLFVAGSLLWRGWGGYLAVGLFATVPLLAMNANGAGFDLTNLVMILTTGLAAWTYLENPVQRRLNTLILCSLLLAQTRYESVLYVAAVAVVALCGWWKAGRVQVTWIGIFAPICLIPFALQQLIFNDYPMLWQLEEGMSAPFSLEFIPKNLIHAIDFMFAFSRDQPNSFLLSCLFTISLIAALVFVASGRIRIDSTDIRRMVPVAFGGIVITNFFLLMAYHWGRLDDISATRIGLPYLLFQVLFVVWVFGKAPRPKLTGSALSVLVILFFVGVTRPLCARSDFLDWGYQVDSARWLDKIAGKYRSESSLFIAGQSITATAKQASAIPLQVDLKTRQRIALHLELKTFGRIFIVFLVDKNPDGGHQTDHSELVEKYYQTEKVEEFTLRSGLVIRLAHLVAVRFLEGESPDFPDRDLLQVSEEVDERLQVFSKTLP